MLSPLVTPIFAYVQGGQGPQHYAPDKDVCCVSLLVAGRGEYSAPVAQYG